MMKRILVCFMAAILLLLLGGCRRRIMPEAEQVVYETYLQQTTEPSQKPDEPSTEETQAPSTEETEPTTVEPDETASADQTIAATQPAKGGDPGPVEPTQPTQPTQPTEVTVTLNANQGQCAPETVSVQVGAAYGDLPEAIRGGYTFTGWYDHKNGGTRIDGSTVVTLAADHTLYAHWAARSGYTVRFDPNGGRLSSDETERLIYSGDAYGDLPVPSRRGYDFSGWFTAAEDGTQVQSGASFTGSEDQTLYAHWTYNPFDYWSFVLENTTEQVYSCQQRSVYLEFDADNVTTNYCSLISATGSYNVAQNRDDMNVTEDWVLGKNPDVIVKVVSDMGSAGTAYGALTARFPGCRVLVVPGEAVYGSAAQTLYYQLCFGKLLYPEWYAEVDTAVVAAELGVSGGIYG